MGNPRQGGELPRSLWLSVVPSGRGRLCLGCLEKRLGRPLAQSDFGELPDDWPRRGSPS